MDVDMDARLADMPIMAQRDDRIEADVFNLWRRARNRWGGPIRLEGLGLKQMEMILTDHYWVCVDAIRYDCPVLAWVEIEDKQRNSLHLPIPCKLNYYHFAASAVRPRVLEKVKFALDQMLREAD
ncbi:hypothetical protein [Magnetospira sp. QH-2]|uniref:hypothetical protein n=1 Tax=Magnetospira sp. (strain QH-2) TaxID=1288970 RepID=UPI0003E80EAD|nr:hypothetical protein [Magnetospira sp. QH-2]CCQ75100.1 conserved protein of unknown function [Magnetospira sp. QH-2]